MLGHHKIGALIAATTLVFAAPTITRAQSTVRIAQTDPRWYAWLGCWGEDDSQTGEQSTSSSATCIVPINGSSAVEALTIARHKVIARDRLDASRPHALDGQGCQGMEAVNWASTGRRVFVRSEYVCTSGVKGTSTTVFAFSPTGEWLRVEEVRSGNGATVTVARLRDIGILSMVAPEAARAIDDKRRAIVAARAAAAAAITAQEVADATYALNPGVVRAWIYASDSRFNLDSRELAALAGADVSLPVLQALAAMTDYPVAPLYSPNRGGNDVYMNSSSVYVAPQVAQAPYDGMPCFAINCPYSPYSAFNGFGFPFGFTSLVTNNGLNNINRRGRQHDGHRGFDGRFHVVIGGPVGRSGGVGVGRR
jgi:hypothetical protein